MTISVIISDSFLLKKVSAPESKLMQLGYDLQ